MKNKDQFITFRVSEEEIAQLDRFCAEKHLGRSKAARLALGKMLGIFYEEDESEKILMKNTMYIEETSRRDIGFHQLLAWDYSALRELLMNRGDDEETADNKIKGICDGHELVIHDGPYTCRYRVATEKELIEARADQDKFDQEDAQQPVARMLYDAIQRCHAAD